MSKQRQSRPIKGNSRVRKNDHESIACVFDENTFIVSKKTKVQYKSIGFDQEDLKELLPLIEEFLS